MSLQKFDSFRNGTTIIIRNEVYNQHMATYSQNKFHQARLNSFRVITGSICFATFRLLPLQ